MGTQREWDCSVADLNVLLTDRIIETGGKRPAETDIARIDWLLASGYLPIGDAGFIDRSSPTSMPKADYTGRAPADVLADCSNQSGKTYFVRWEECATFPDPTSPWIAGTFVSTYAAPVGTGWSSTDSLDGQYGGSLGDGYNYVSAVYPSTRVYSGTESAPDAYPPAVNGGTGLAQYGAKWGQPFAGLGPGFHSVDDRWIWDLASAGSPNIATVGLIGWNDGNFHLYPVPWTMSIDYSDNGTSWTTLFDDAAIRASGAHGGVFIGSVDYAHSGHRYWSLHITASVTVAVAMSLDWKASGFMLWSGSAPCSPGPALGYHDPLWSGDSSSIRISNDPADIDHVTTFAIPPTATLDRDPARLFSGCHYEYSGGSVYEENATTKSTYFSAAQERFGRDTRASDMNCTTAATATTLATANLARAASEEGTVTGAVIQRMTAAQVNLARQGQRIQVKLTHVPGLETFTWMAIRHRTVTPFAVGLYDVELAPALPVLTGFRGGGFGIADPVRPAPWVRNIAAVVAATTDPTNALAGQRVEPTFIANGDGSTDLFTLATAYMPGSLLLWVDAQPIPTSEITETSPSAGTFTLDFAPSGASGSASAEALTASWQVA